MVEENRKFLYLTIFFAQYARPLSFCKTMRMIPKSRNPKALAVLPSYHQRRLFKRWTLHRRFLRSSTRRHHTLGSWSASPVLCSWSAFWWRGHFGKFLKLKSKYANFFHSLKNYAIIFLSLPISLFRFLFHHLSVEHVACHYIVSQTSLVTKECWYLSLSLSRRRPVSLVSFSRGFDLGQVNGIAYGGGWVSSGRCWDVK